MNLSFPQSPEVLFQELATENKVIVRVIKKKKVKQLQEELFIHQTSYLPWLLSLQEAQGFHPGPGSLSYQLDQDLQEPLCYLNMMAIFTRIIYNEKISGQGIVDS